MECALVSGLNEDMPIAEWLKKEDDLDEELGIQSLSCELLIPIEHTYPEKTVLLDTWIVRDFGGEAYGREG